MAITSEEYQLVENRIDELRVQCEDRKSYVEKLERALPTDLEERVEIIVQVKDDARWSKEELLGKLSENLWETLRVEIRKELPIVPDPQGPEKGWFALEWREGLLYRKDVIRHAKYVDTYLEKTAASTRLALDPPDPEHRLTQEGIDEIDDVLESDRHIKLGRILQARKLLRESISQKQTEILVKELKEAGIIEEKD